MPSDLPPPIGPPGPPPGGVPADQDLDPPGTAPRRLHPATIVVGIDPRALVAGGIGLVSLGPVGLVLAVPFLLLVFGYQWLVWDRFRYGFDGHVIRIEHGVLQRRLRSIDVARIQQVELDQPLLHRLFGLAVLRLETASEGGETEVELPAVALATAEALRRRLRAVAVTVSTGDGTAPVAASPATPVLTVPYHHVALAAVTGAQLLALPAAAFVLFDLAADAGGVEDASGAVAGLVGNLGLVTLLVLLPLVLIAAVVSAVLRDGQVVVERRGDDLQVTRGLLSTRQAVLPRHRIQLVEIRQNWLRRLFGMASVSVRSAGGGANQDQHRRIVVPLVRTGADLDRLLGALLPTVPTWTSWRRHPRRARRRMMVRWTLRLVPLGLTTGLAAVVLGLVLGQVPTLVTLAAVLLVLAGPALGAVEYSNLAHAVTDGAVGTRHGAFGITTGIAPLARLQAVTQSANPFQRRLSLASVDAHLAGTGTTILTVLDVDAADALALRARLTAAAAGRPSDGPGGAPTV
jgi:putative membrane protein